MLKAVSSITNAIGALNYKGTWNASTNSPALASGVGTKGDYYVVGTAGTTTLDGISNWGVGDWAVFNGSVWQRVEGGADLNGVNLTATGSVIFSSLTGYLKGNGASQLTASATVPNTDVSGLGTMSTQNASNVAVTGGSINGTTLGATTAATGRVTTLTVTTQANVPGGSGGGWRVDGTIAVTRDQDFSIAQIGFNDATMDIRTNSANRMRITTTYLRPSNNNAMSLGDGTNRWSEVFAVNGTINTSDAREKTAVSVLTDAELNAAKQLAKEIGTFKFLESVAKKGDAARSHVGMTVQRAIEIMQANGLDPFAYGFICYNKWDDQVRHYEAKPEVPAVLDEDGNIIEPGIPAQPERTEVDAVAGDRYGFRVDQLLLFMARGFEARLSALEGA